MFNEKKISYCVNDPGVHRLIVRNNRKNDGQDFLTLWKDADPDIPILKQAKAEYAKLQ